MSNTLEELRKMASELIASKKESVDANKWGRNVENLLHELSVYHIELQHQNSALEKSEKDLAQSRAEYVNLFENAPVGYVVINQERIIQKVNRTFVNTYIPMRARADELEGRPFDDFVCAEYKSAFELFCKMLKKPGIPIPIELKLMDRFGASHYVLITAGERWSDSTIFQLTINDISMQKKMEAQLVRAKEKAEESDRQKSLFLTNVSHELRTPLTTIIGYSEILEDPKLDKMSHKECVDSIYASGEMLMSLTNEILELSVLESGAIPLRGSDTDMVRICSEMATLVQRKITDKNVLIRSELEKIPMLWADQLRLRQIILSVLKHASSNATDGTILIRGRFEPNEGGNDGMLILNFSGSNIFSSESSLGMDISRKPITQNCAGLGMFLAKQIVKVMNGEMIWVHPLDSLRLEIPLKISKSPAPQKSGVENVKAVDVPAKNCLLVDDVVMNLKVLAAMMKRLNYVPTLTSSAKEALQMLSKHKFDLIMTDLWMPEMSGEDFAVMVRQNPDYDNIPIVAVTADIERENNFDMDFFVDTIIKPVDKAKLEKMLVRVNERILLKKGELKSNQEF